LIFEQNSVHTESLLSCSLPPRTIHESNRITIADDGILEPKIKPYERTERAIEKIEKKIGI
jgi:hypothetical protein